jgi:hypothetical protein
VTLCLVVVVAGQRCPPGLLPCGSALRGLGRSPHLVDLLGGGLVVCPISQTCSAGIWLVAPPHRLARRGLGRSSCLAHLVGGDLVGRPAQQTYSGGIGRLLRLIALFDGDLVSHPPGRLAQRGLGRSHCLADLLDRDLVVRPASLTCSAGTWSVASPDRLARQGLGRSSLKALFSILVVWMTTQLKDWSVC